MATATGSRDSSTREGISFEVVDIEQQPEAAELVEQANDGNQTVPTLVYADGSAQTNPSLAQVKDKLAELALCDSAPRRLRCECSEPRNPSPAAGERAAVPVLDQAARDRDAAGQDQGAGLGLGLHLRAGEPAGVLDLVVVDDDVAW